VIRSGRPSIFSYIKFSNRNRYGIPIDNDAFKQKIIEVEAKLKESHNVLEVTRAHLEESLQKFSRPASENHTYSHIEGLRLFILKEKSLYHALNKLKPQSELFMGKCWCPNDKVREVDDTLAALSRKKGSVSGYGFQKAAVPEGLSPPTRFRTNEYTGVFQEIVNTYGVPRYREINPGLFTIVTFPFLFGVMFGDIAHGALLLSAGLYLIIWKDFIEAKRESLWKVMLPVRYLLALQGFFALYCGFIYNDFAAVPFDLFGTCYDAVPAPGTSSLVKVSDCTYAFGVDPHWYGKTNELTFLNSFKMKTSIILGVTQMIFGRRI